MASPMATGGLAVWRERQAEGLARGQARLDRLARGWSGLLLFAMTLYVLIGQAPYQHEAILDPVTGVAPVSPFNRYVWLGLLAGSLPVLWVRRSELVDAARRLWPLLALYGWFVLTMIWALDPDAAKRRLFLYVVDLVICVALCLGMDRRQRHLVLAAACGLVILIDFASWLLAPGVSMTELGLAAIHTHKNTLGAVMMLSGVVIAPLAFTQRSRGGALAWGALWLVSIALLVASRSKTSLAITLGVIAAAPLLVATLRLARLRLWALGLGLALILGSGAFLWAAYAYVQGASPLDPLSHVTFTQRTDVWRFVLDEAAKRPVGGAGFGSFWDVDPAVQPSLQTDYWFSTPDAYTNQSHNGYLDLLVTTGLIGLAGAATVLGRWIWRGLTQLRQIVLSPIAQPQDLAFGVFLALFPLMVFIHNWMESTLFTANTIFGLFILLAGVDLDLDHGERRASAVG